MPLQYGAGISKTVECPQTMVGRVIGKGGETIKALQKHFGCNIQIDQQSHPMSLTVAGQPSAVEAAMAACQEILAGGNPPFLGGPLGGPAGFPGGESQLCTSEQALEYGVVSEYSCLALQGFANGSCDQ